MQERLSWVSEEQPAGERVSKVSEVTQKTSEEQSEEGTDKITENIV